MNSQCSALYFFIILLIYEKTKFKNIIIRPSFIPVPTSLFLCISKSNFYLNNTEILEILILILYYPLLIIEKTILSIKRKNSTTYHFIFIEEKKSIFQYQSFQIIQPKKEHYFGGLKNNVISTLFVFFPNSKTPLFFFWTHYSIVFKASKNQKIPPI